jgi:hypothetical protein
MEQGRVLKREKMARNTYIPLAENTSQRSGIGVGDLLPAQHMLQRLQREEEHSTVYVFELSRDLLLVFKFHCIPVLVRYHHERAPSRGLLIVVDRIVH